MYRTLLPSFRPQRSHLFVNGGGLSGTVAIADPFRNCAFGSLLACDRVRPRRPAISGVHGMVEKALPRKKKLIFIKLKEEKRKKKKGNRLVPDLMHACVDARWRIQT